MKKIIFTVNNELNYDQRMIRICTTLAANNYNVLLVGKFYRDSLSLVQKNFQQHRIRCRFKTGKKAYVEYNLKLFFYLLLRKSNAFCAIDLDTIVPVLLISAIKQCKRIYDAHELFVEMKEVVSRPLIRNIWSWVERNTVPHFRAGYTVSQSIAEVFYKKYARHYEVIRNVPKLDPTFSIVEATEKYILYQGAVNVGRCMEKLLPAMRWVNARLVICGDGNYMKQSRKLVRELQLENKVIFKGMLLPQELNYYASRAYIGVNLVEPDGLNQLYSLANKFFDYIHAALPQLSMDFVEYARVNNEDNVALLIAEPDPVKIADALNLLLENDVLYKELRENCIKAREIYNWQKEEKKLLGFYEKIFN